MNVDSRYYKRTAFPLLRLHSLPQTLRNRIATRINYLANIRRKRTGNNTF